ncbi:hypothetical protein LZ31DRAFT_377016 [Colletotrichum somersetense]|nr:hypothetical protein LZ31DRAFT_377016 [Colletotrichum somersetense]
MPAIISFVLFSITRLPLWIADRNVWMDGTPERQTSIVHEALCRFCGCYFFFFPPCIRPADTAAPYYRFQAETQLHARSSSPLFQVWSVPYFHVLGAPSEAGRGSTIHNGLDCHRRKSWHMTTVVFFVPLFFFILPRIVLLSLIAFSKRPSATRGQKAVSTPVFDKHSASCFREFYNPD